MENIQKRKQELYTQLLMLIKEQSIALTEKKHANYVASNNNLSGGRKKNISLGQAMNSSFSAMKNTVLFH